MTEATNLQQLGASDADLAKIDSVLNELAASADARFVEYVPEEQSAEELEIKTFLDTGLNLRSKWGSEVLAGRIWSEGPKLQRDPR